MNSKYLKNEENMLPYLYKNENNFKEPIAKYTQDRNPRIHVYLIRKELLTLP